MIPNYRKEGIMSNEEIKEVSLCIIVVAAIVIGCSKKEPSAPVIDPGAIDPGNVQQVISGFGGVNIPGWIQEMTLDVANKAFNNGPGQV